MSSLEHGLAHQLITTKLFDVERNNNEIVFVDDNSRGTGLDVKQKKGMKEVKTIRYDVNAKLDPSDLDMNKESSSVI